MSDAASTEPTGLRPRLLIIAAALLWSTGGAAIKLADLSAIQITGGRAVFAGVLLYVLLPEARRPWNREVMKTAVAYAFTMFFFVSANRLTTAANAIFIQNIAPVWVLLLGPALLGEKPNRPELLSVPVSLIGCALFFAQDFAVGRISGNLFAAGASVSYAILILRYRKLSSAEGLSATVAGNVLVVVLASPWLVDLVTHPPTTMDWMALIYLGTIQQALAAVLFVRGIRGASALEGSLLILFEPLFSPLWAYLLIGEIVGPWALLGAGLIVLATVWRTLALTRRARRPANS